MIFMTILDTLQCIIRSLMQSLKTRGGVPLSASYLACGTIHKKGGIDTMFNFKGISILKKST